MVSLIHARMRELNLLGLKCKRDSESYLNVVIHMLLSRFLEEEGEEEK